MVDPDLEGARRNVLDPVLRGRARYEQAFLFATLGVLCYADLRLGDFDVLLDLAGYLFLVLAAGYLLAFHRLAHPLQLTAMALVPFGLVEFLDGNLMDSLRPFLVAVASALQVLAVWFLLGIVADLGLLLRDERLRRDALQRRAVFVGAWASFVAIGFLAQAFGAEGTYRLDGPAGLVAGLLLLLALLALFVLVVAILWRARLALAPPRRQP